ncbi:hypothetical protein LOTGIDRAFT_167633 [Lottia gigantea]|uniref:EGF-like domain-containing protein n=1 Tax=Lottia gigantea TaxID=225164 RepID=V3ZTM5_LOTGI|nr:hypothetical protein LOTGIDRAFT_167633 [Lottia gigantea]ESO85880.1 hypothetical protein LOTGIDRAFT_167633 [Lottia gigantea]
MERLNSLVVVLLLPLLCFFHQYRLESVIFSQMINFADIPKDMEKIYHGTKPSLISCGIHCLKFPRAFSFVVCRDSNNTIDCYCTAVTDFYHSSTDKSCSVFTKPKCKNDGYFDGRVCNCKDGFIGSMCEIEVNSSSCQNENVRIVDPMTTAALQDVLRGKGTLKQQVHVDNLDIIYNTFFFSTSDHGGISESIEHLEIDIRNRSNSEVYRTHRMFMVSNEMATLRLGFGTANVMEMATETSNVQLKGLINERIGFTNIVCLDVKNGQVVSGSAKDCFRGVLKGFAPTFAEYSHHRVDSVQLKNNELFFKLMSKMVRRESKTEYASYPAQSGHHRINSRGISSHIYWNINTNSLSKWINFELPNYIIYLDTTWHLAYSNDLFGNPNYGFLAYLYDSVVGGKRVRVAVDGRIYSVSNTHLNHEHITVCVTDVYNEEAWTQQRPVQIRQEVSTDGDYRLCSFQSESDLETSSSSGLDKVTWFVENRCWKEIIKFGYDKTVVSGTVQELFQVASSGKSLRIVVASSSTKLEIIDVNIVYLFNGSRVVLDSGSFGIIDQTNGRDLTCLQKSYSFYSDGMLEYSIWPASRSSPVLRLYVSSYTYIKVLSEY